MQSFFPDTRNSLILRLGDRRDAEAWERFAAIQQRLAENRAVSDALGAPREGTSLLGGLVRCGRGGQRLQPIYSSKTGRLRSRCWRGAID